MQLFGSCSRSLMHQQVNGEAKSMAAAITFTQSVSVLHGAHAGGVASQAACCAAAPLTVHSCQG